MWLRGWEIGKFFFCVPDTFFLNINHLLGIDINILICIMIMMMMMSRIFDNISFKLG